MIQIGMLSLNNRDKHMEKNFLLIAAEDRSPGPQLLTALYIPIVLTCHSACSS